MTILEKIKSDIDNLVLERYGVKDEFSYITFMKDGTPETYGDIASTTALNLAAKIKKDPLVIAEELEGDLVKIGYKVSVARPGFINIFLTNEAVNEDLKNILERDFIETKYSGKNILVEHSSPNLFKPFHIGHLMNNIIGESIVRLMKSTNANVKTMSFPSDISIGIAKAIYVLKNKNFSFDDPDIVKVLGEAYVEGVNLYENADEKTQSEIKEVANSLFLKDIKSEDWQIFEKAKAANIEYFEKVVSGLGSHFDHFIYESEAGGKGEEIVRENTGEGKVFEEGEDRVILFDTKRQKNKETDETIKFVFINSEGNPTYEAKDLGLLELKHEYFDFEKSFFVTDSEQVPHFEVVMQAAKEIDENFKSIVKKSQHIPHGRLNLKGEERMSSRLGNVLTVEEVLDIVNKKVEEKLSDRVEGLSIEEKENLIKKISLSALRVAILKSKPGLNIEFDLNNSLNFEGATGPYLLYTYARANSIVEKSESLDLENRVFDIEVNPLTKKIIESESVYKKAIEEIAPQLVVKYLFELAQSFNTFYAKEKFIDEEDLNKTAKNIYLAKVFMKALKLGLNMISIEEVGQM